MTEPAGSEPVFGPVLRAWKERQPSQHRYEDWKRFWSRVSALIDYDHGFLGEPVDQERIGDTLSVKQWIGLIADAGFASIDIPLRDVEKVALACAKP